MYKLQLITCLETINHARSKPFNLVDQDNRRNVIKTFLLLNFEFITNKELVMINFERRFLLACY